MKSFQAVRISWTDPFISYMPWTSLEEVISNTFPSMDVVSTGILVEETDDYVTIATWIADTECIRNLFTVPKALVYSITRLEATKTKKPNLKKLIGTPVLLIFTDATSQRAANSLKEAREFTPSGVAVVGTVISVSSRAVAVVSTLSESGMTFDPLVIPVATITEIVPLQIPSRKKRKKQ